jgi:hypothetical protein
MKESMNWNLFYMFQNKESSIKSASMMLYQLQLREEFEKFPYFTWNEFDLSLDSSNIDLIDSLPLLSNAIQTISLHSEMTKSFLHEQLYAMGKKYAA